MTAGEGKRPQLGRGLSALLGDDAADYAELDRVRAAKPVTVDRLRPSPFQPRHRMSDEGLDDLARSIAEKGVLQPLLVRRDPDDGGAFEIIAGERRWRAAQKAGVHEVPVVVKDLDDSEALEIALVENLQREDLSAIDEAEGYRRLMEEFQHTQERLAQAVGKSRSHVANTLRLLTLPQPVRDKIAEGAISAGHARALVGVADAVGLAEQVVRRGLNVRQTERLAKSAGKPSPSRTAAEKDADTVALERELATLLGLAVEIRHREGKGSLVLHYRSLEQLDDILHRLSHGAHGRTAGDAAEG